MKYDMKNNLKFFLALGNAKLVMLDCAGHSTCYGKTNQEYSLSKIAYLLQNK